MSSDSAISTLLRENKALFILIAVGIFLIELEIFAFAAMKSGRKSRLQVIDHTDTVIYETNGSDLSSFNKYYFEKTFGPLDQYRVNLVTQDVPFPFRAWFAAAVGIPVGAVLLFGFITRAYVSIFHGHVKFNDTPETPGAPAQTRLEKILFRISRFNVFTIGFLVFLMVFAYWTIPNAISYIGQAGIELLVRFKWVFIPMGIGLCAIIIWMIYLRYLLAKKTLETQMELTKYRLQLEMTRDAGPLALPQPPPTRQVAWEPNPVEKTVDNGQTPP